VSLGGVRLNEGDRDLDLRPTDDAVVTGTLQDGTPYSVPTFVPNAAVVAANGNSRLLTNRLDYGNQYHGVDIVLLKRMSNRSMMDPAARGKSPTAFGRRCIPADCVAPPSNIPDILGRRALSSGRLAAVGATPGFHRGLLARRSTTRRCSTAAGRCRAAGTRRPSTTIRSCRVPRSRRARTGRT
jgi:hypothetical protein